MPEEVKDGRVVYGALCVWWDTIDKVSTNATGLPVCPHCRKPLMEVDSIEQWQENIRAFVESGDVEADYEKKVAWMRGRCFPTWDAAMAQYAKEQ